MLAKRIVEQLKSYKQNKACCGVLSLRIAEYERILNALIDTAQADHALSPHPLTGMPLQQHIHDSVACLACAFADQVEPKDIAELRRDIEALKEQKRRLEIEISCVDAWLIGLAERERWLIVQKEIEGTPWHVIVSEYERVYGVAYSCDGLKNKKLRIIGKIIKMIS